MIFDDLLPDEGLILRLGVEKIEQQNVDRNPHQNEVGRIGVKTLGGIGGNFTLVWSRTFVFLLERSDNLRGLLSSGDVKISSLSKARNGLPLFVGDNYVHRNDAAFGFDGGP